MSNEQTGISRMHKIIQLECRQFAKPVAYFIHVIYTQIGWLHIYLFPIHDSPLKLWKNKLERYITNK